MEQKSNNKANIKVGIRIRPPLPREIKDGKLTTAIANNNNKIYVSLNGKPVVVSSDD